jgi:hypothetical protein
VPPFLSVVGRSRALPPQSGREGVLTSGSGSPQTSESSITYPGGPHPRLWDRSAWSFCRTPVHEPDTRRAALLMSPAISFHWYPGLVAGGGPRFCLHVCLAGRGLGWGG